MKDTIIPDFLKLENHKRTELGDLIREYKVKIGEPWATAGTDYSDDDLKVIFRKCLDENRTFNDVIGFNPNELYEEDLI